MGRHWVFQKDNDPKHVAKSTQKWLSSKSSSSHDHLSPQTSTQSKTCGAS